MIKFYIHVEEQSDGHVAIALRSDTPGQFCSKGELQVVRKLYAFMNKEFHNLKGGDVQFRKTGKG